MTAPPATAIGPPPALGTQPLALEPGILRETTMGGDVLTLWVPGPRENGGQMWERISAPSRGEFAADPGVAATPATLLRLRQSLDGFFGRILRRWSKSSSGQAWIIPEGGTATQVGSRQTDLLLVWARDEAVGLTPERVRARWPESTGVRRLGPALFLVTGIEAPREKTEEDLALEQGCPNKLAERMLETARRERRPAEEAAALTDLGLLHLHAAQAAKAVEYLTEALTAIRATGDRSREGDVLANLGLALLVAGQPSRALTVLDEALVLARQAHDPFAEKLALDRLGLTHARLGDPLRGIDLMEQALTMARSLGHVKHEGEILWQLAIQNADLGRREEALALAQANVDLLARTHNPQSAWFADHLRRYREGESAAGLPAAEEAPGTELPFGGTIAVSPWGPTSAGSPATPRGPGLLRMALTAARSMAKFIGSGFKMTPVPTLQRRLRSCAACEHHTGLRCRLCGCFTHAKARLAHEACPMGKWGPADLADAPSANGPPAGSGKA